MALLPTNKQDKKHMKKEKRKESRKERRRAQPGLSGSNHILSSEGQPNNLTPYSRKRGSPTNSKYASKSEKAGATENPEKRRQDGPHKGGIFSSPRLSYSFLFKTALIFFSLHDRSYILFSFAYRFAFKVSLIINTGQSNIVFQPAIWVCLYQIANMNVGARFVGKGPILFHYQIILEAVATGIMPTFLLSVFS